jgi:hypothetical protein
MDILDHHRRAAAGGLAAALVVIGGAVASCTHPVPPSGPTPITTATTPATTPGTVAGKNCGTVYYATGWPTTPAVFIERQGGDCLRTAFLAGDPARLVTRQQTDGAGGHILITTYDVIGVSRLRVTADPTGAAEPGPVAVSECGGLDFSSDHHSILVSDCTPA